MMALTHGAASVALVALATPILGDYAGPPLLLAALVGGLAPDVDLLADHRKSLHYPVGYSVLALGALGGLLATGAAPLALAAVAVGAAALHAWSDALAGSVEAEPWNPTTERAVYNHALGRWHRPRRYVRYSGAPEDGLLALAAAGVAIASPATGPTAEAGLWWLAAVAAGYALTRRRLAGLPGSVASLLPPRLVGALPSVRVDETDSGATTLSIRFRP
ncbi:metal-dependent hydrolase [Haloarcula laminariae]|uniref:metal-dependent hydrolase n=1 Tax=Haloarcula laminariae TaxID=2961577 RepID=UPI0024064694|nr:metal-dependent hydrolase [Halomicroarcula sp. FL173]